MPEKNKEKREETGLPRPHPPALQTHLLTRSSETAQGLPNFQNVLRAERRIAGGAGHPGCLGQGSAAAGLLRNRRPRKPFPHFWFLLLVCRKLEVVK